MNMENKKIGGHLLADQLNINGVDTIFCVPGDHACFFPSEL